jgi:hypothetical protein
MFSKCPEMHRRDLEIRHIGKVHDGTRHEPAFHFSNGNYGYYWLCTYFICENSDNRSAKWVDAGSIAKRCCVDGRWIGSID